MKKITSLVLLALCGSIHAQNSVPNGNFESWTTHAYSFPTNYPFCNNSEHPEASAFPITRVSGVSGYALQLETTDRYGFGFCLNAMGQDGPPTHGGIPISQKPTGIQLSYKYNSLYDHGILYVSFSKNGVNIGQYMVNLEGVHTDWAAFSQTFSPALTETPDSVIVGFVSSNFQGVSYPGSILAVDNLSFTGISSQPTLLNGDFEQWSDVTTNTPNTWDLDFDAQGVHRSTDAYEGQYAVRLATYADEGGGEVKKAQIWTGYWDKECENNCYPQGGQPFAQTDDVLEFYYKYTPTNGQPASVDFFFRKRLNPTSTNSGWSGHKTLDAASQWTYAEAPIHVDFMPDSVVVQFSCPTSDANLTVADVGSTLLIDKVVFRSQKNNSGVNNILSDKLALYPNPASDIVKLNLVENAEINIYKLTGELLKTLKISPNGQFSVSNVNAGIYILEAKTVQGSAKQKLIIQH